MPDQVMHVDFVALAAEKASQPALSALMREASGLTALEEVVTAGVVEAVGSGVADIRPGDRVAWAAVLGAYATHAIVPAAKTIGGPGTRLMVPLGHIHAAYVRSHFGTAEMTLWDAPRRDEIALGLVMATGGRPHARIGGLKASDISVHDGQR